MIIPMLQRERSLDDFVDPDTETRMGEFLADPKAENPLQRVHEIELVCLVRRALVSLDERERHIIRTRFGLFGGAEQTLDEIGRSLRISRERVRQLECKAKKTLRAKLVGLRAYVG